MSMLPIWNLEIDSLMTYSKWNAISETLSMTSLLTIKLCKCLWSCHQPMQKIKGITQLIWKGGIPLMSAEDKTDEHCPGAGILDTG